MSICLFPRSFTTRKRARFDWRRVFRRAEPLEHRELLSATGLVDSVLNSLVAVPTAYGMPLVTNTVASGATPAQIRQAYGFDQVTFNNGTSTITGDGSGQTIAIIDAYGDSKIASDLHTFDAQFGLADPALKVVNQNGGAKLPGNNSGWALETALDVEWAHAMAPQASLLLVEANSSSLGNLLTAVNYARQQPGVVAVSMSWGAGEFSGETSYDGYFTTPSGHGGITFLAASGDSGAGTIWPAASPNVLAIGGTTLNIDSSGDYLSESGWSGSGGGVSLYESQPTYQSQSGLVTQNTTQRTSPDVAFDANPNTGVAVYSSVTYNSQSGWFQVGGTSAAAPQLAALVAVADQGRQVANAGTANPLPNAQASIYNLASNATSYSSDFHDITTGSNGSAPLDSATAGYDLVTGLGTPKVAALVQGLVSAQATTVVTTASATNGKSGSASPSDTPLDPRIVAAIIATNIQPTPATLTSTPLVGSPTTSNVTPAVSSALPSAAPLVQLGTNSLLSDDPSAAPFKPGRRGQAPATQPSDTDSPKTRGAVRQGDAASLIGEVSRYSNPHTAELIAACDTIYSDEATVDTLHDIGQCASAIDLIANFRASQVAALMGLTLAAALVDRSEKRKADDNRRQSVSLPRRRSSSR